MSVSVSIDPDKDNIDIPLFASIDDIAKSFILTSDQHMGLLIAGSGFLRSLRVKEIKESSLCNGEEYNPCNMAMILHGVGGSGKSLLALAASWMRQGSIITSAISGVATANVSGYTIASLLNCKKNIFQRIKVIGIDEMSMVGLKMLSKFSGHISDELGNNLPFGG